MEGVSLSYTKGFADGYASNTGNDGSITYNYHYHKDGLGNNPHTETITTNAGGCFTEAVLHKHTGSCYATPVYHQHVGSNQSGTGCYYGAYHSGWAHPNCSCGAAPGECGYGNGYWWHYYDLGCGKTTSTIEYYALSCPKTETTLDYYKPTCGLTDGQIISAEIVFN